MQIPHIHARAPAGNIEKDNSLHFRQFHRYTVTLQGQFRVQIGAGSLQDIHSAVGEVEEFVHVPAGEKTRNLFTLPVEIQRYEGVHSHADVVVGDETFGWGEGNTDSGGRSHFYFPSVDVAEGSGGNLMEEVLDVDR